MHTDRCGNTRRQKCCAKGSRKEIKIQEFMNRVQRMWNLKCMIVPVIIGALRKLKEKFGICTRKTFDRLTIKDSYTLKITYNMKSTAV